MNIQYLKLNNFGRFNKKEIELSDGINVVYGENEAGKTTVHSFVRAMFFGVARSRGRAAANDAYSQYEPWENPAFYEGSMEFMSMGKSYRIDRVFNKNVRSVILTDKVNGSVIPMSERGLETVIDGFSEESFYNTISVSQTETGIDGIIANLNMSRSSEINVREALESLSEKKKSLEKKKQNLGIDEIENRLREYEHIDQKIEDISNHLKMETQKIRKLEKMNDTGKSDRKPGSEDIAELDRADMNYKVKNGAKEIFIQRMSVLLPIIALACGYGFIKMNKWYLFAVAIICVVADLFIIYSALKKAASARGKNIGQKPYDTSEKTGATLAGSSKMDTGQESVRIDNEINELRTETAKNIERLGWEIDSLTVLANRRDDLQEELEECRRKKQELDKESASVALAISTIQSFSKDIETGFGEILNELASEYISRFTRGKYDNLRIVGNMNVTICEDGRVVSMNNVSYATKEQIHLSVRLAASRLLFPKEQMPLILDEAFAHYDDMRLEDTLLSLASMGTQIIIFTCTGREREILESSGTKYKYIEL